MTNQEMHYLKKNLCATSVNNLVNHLRFCFTFLQLAESAKAQFSSRDHSDHLAIVRAYEGWKDAEREQSGYEYCYRNFLSSQTLRAIDSLRKQFFYLLKDTGLVDQTKENCNIWSHNEHLIRSIICAGLFPGICSVVVSWATSGFTTHQLLHFSFD